MVMLMAVIERFSWPVSASGGRSGARASMREARPAAGLGSCGPQQSMGRVLGGLRVRAARPPLRRHRRRLALWDGGRVRLEDLVRVRRARDLMDRDYAKPLDVPALARTAFLSPGHFSRSFRAAFGETPYSYLMTRRIERAKGLLRRGDLTVTEVCFAVGCTSLGSFSSRFTDWSARAKAPPGPAAMTRAPPSRPAWPRSTRDRSGMEKPTLPSP